MTRPLLTPPTHPRVPLIRATPARLSELGPALAAIERSGIYSNFGPVNTRFEQALTERVFGGAGACVTVCNATIGLMIALREAADRAGPGRTLALMPAYTFAATAHAALWAGLTPLLCDSDPELWTASAEAEDALLARHGEAVGVIVPYATFGAAIDLGRYERLAAKHGVGVVIDAAASLGTIDLAGRAFGAGAPFAVVFSMHATKTFSTAEGGVIHSGDAALIGRLRAMSNFGFAGGRSALMPGLNAKLNEIMALMALHKLAEFDALAAHRDALVERYRAGLPGFQFQARTASRQAAAFMPVLLPEALAPLRPVLIERLAELGIGAGCYFSPHLGQQPHFVATAQVGAMPVADALARRMLNLPIYDAMTVADVATVCAAVRAVCLEL